MSTTPRQNWAGGTAAAQRWAGGTVAARGQGAGSGDAAARQLASGFRVGTGLVQTAFGGEAGTWDERGRFGTGVAAGNYSGSRITLPTDFEIERVARIGVNYGAAHVDAVGNDIPPVGAVALASGAVAICAGLCEVGAQYAGVNADNSYAFVYTGGIPLGMVGLGVANPTAGERLIVLGGNGSITLFNTSTGAIAATVNPSHPSGFNSGHYNRHVVTMAVSGTSLFLSYLQQDRVHEYTIDSDGDSITFVQSFTVTAPAGVAVGTDGRALVIVGVTATVTADQFKSLTGTSGGSVIKLNANGSTTEVLADATVPNPWRLAVNASTGDIAVTSWAPDHCLRIYNSSWVLQRTLGTSGGRVNGVYDGTDFFQLNSVSWDGSDLWVTEFCAAARATRKINGTTGAVLRTLFGGQRFEASCCPEGGDDPTKVWGHSTYGLNRYSLDPATGEWSLLECYQSESNLGSYKEIKSVRLNGVVYLYSSGTYFRMWVYDPAEYRLRMVIQVGAVVNATDGWLTSAQQTALAALHPGVGQYLWTAPEGSTDFQASVDYDDFTPWNLSTPAWGCPREINVGADLTLYMGRTRLPCSFTPASVRADGVPLYNVANRVDYANLTIDGQTITSDVTDLYGHGGYVYQLFGVGRGGSGDFGYGQYYHSASAGVAYLVKRNASTGAVVWISGLKESNWNKRPGRLHWSRKVGAVSHGFVWCHHSGDTDGNGGCALFDADSGVWVADLTTTPVADGSPLDFAHHKIVNGDICTINVCDDPADADDALVFTGTLTFSSVTRVTGLVRATRQTFTRSVTTATTDVTADGTGLTLKCYNSADLSGSAAVTLTRNFTLLNDAVLSAVTSNPFSFTLEGTVTPIKTGPHRFMLCPPGEGTRLKLWVGGTQVCDTDGTVGVASRTSSTMRLARSAPITLTAGTPVTVRAEATSVVRSSSFGLASDWARYISLNWMPPGGDERDIPTTLCHPSGTGTLAASAYNAWAWPSNPSPLHWPLRAITNRRTSGTGVADLVAIGTVTAVTDDDGGACLEMSSTLNSPAILHSHRSPWPEDYEGWGAGSGSWAVEFKLKTTVAEGRDSGFGGFRNSQVYGNSYYTAPKMTLYSGNFTVIGMANSEVSGTKSLADGEWHTIRVDVSGTVTVTIDGVAFGSPTTLGGARLAPPHGVAISAPVPAVSGTTYVWRVRDFKIWPRL